MTAFGRTLTVKERRQYLESNRLDKSCAKERVIAELYWRQSAEERGTEKQNQTSFPGGGTNGWNPDPGWAGLFIDRTRNIFPLNWGRWTCISDNPFSYLTVKIGYQLKGKKHEWVVDLRIEKFYGRTREESVPGPFILYLNVLEYLKELEIWSCT